MSLLDTLPKPEAAGCVLDFAGIRQLLPHRFPFLMLDRVLEIEPGVKLVARKNVSFNEPFFQGHFPEEPVMPGVMQVEAMAQAAAVLMLLADESLVGKRPAFMGVDECRFRKPVRPGDVLVITVTLEKMRRGIGTCKAEVHVDGTMVSNAILTATMV
jgi:beta-hydroxyacyl-ACP dehydratase FabZ